MPPKTQKITLKDDDGSTDTFKIKKGALKRQLGVPQEYRFNRKDLTKMVNTDKGKTFEFQGRRFKMTSLLKRRVSLALTLMKGT